MRSESELDALARHLCRHAGISWAGVFCNSLHVPARLRTALQGHLCHLAGLKPPKRRKQQCLAPAKRAKRVPGTKTFDTTADQEPVQQLITPIAKLLHFACTGNTSELQQLVQHHALDVNERCGCQGRTALHAAAEHGHADTCSALLGLGADSYRYDDKQVSALMLAAKHGHHHVVKVLLDAGADAFAVDNSGTNALLLAASCGSAQCVQLLLQEGYVDADYSNTDLGGGEHALLLAAAGGHADCAELLLAAGAKVNRTDKEGRTALWVASSCGHLAVVRLLLVQPRIKHIRHFVSGTTPIMEAQAAGHAALAALLAAHLAQQQPAKQWGKLPQLKEAQQQQQGYQPPASGNASNRIKQWHCPKQQQQQQQQLGEIVQPASSRQQKASGSLATVQLQQQQQHQHQHQSWGNQLQQPSRPARVHIEKQHNKQQQQQQQHRAGGKAACHHMPAAAVHIGAKLQQQKEQAACLAGGSLSRSSKTILNDMAVLPGVTASHVGCAY